MIGKKKRIIGGYYVYKSILVIFLKQRNRLQSWINVSTNMFEMMSFQKRKKPNLISLNTLL